MVWQVLIHHHKHQYAAVDNSPTRPRNIFRNQRDWENPSRDSTRSNDKLTIYGTDTKQKHQTIITMTKKFLTSEFRANRDLQSKVCCVCVCVCLSPFGEISGSVATTTFIFLCIFRDVYCQSLNDCH